MATKRKRRNTSLQKSKRADPLSPIPGVELFFGLVGPTGTDLSAVIEELQSQLDLVGYKTEVISLSNLISTFSGKAPTGRPEYERIRLLMDEGTRLREKTKRGDFLARLALAEILRVRKKITGNSRTPAQNVAYVLRSFKRPEEVELLRTIYGRAFNLISVYASLQDRLESLSKRLADTSKKPLKSMEHKALELINIDAEEEGRELGQNVRDTFPLADYFVDVKDPTTLKSQLERLVHLVFADPFLTPTREECAMFFAQAAAMRSADLSRQVGAVVISKDGEVLASGANEVPKAGGGLYWADDKYVKRDLELGFDKNAKVRKEIVEELFHRLRDNKWLSKKYASKDDTELYQLAVMSKDGLLKDSQIVNVIEFGRAVHAEMAAITDATKRGVSIAGARLFCTTFPCHLCARHILSSGLAEVVYIEPYPKSRTEELYADSIAINPRDKVPDKVGFFPFVGVAPRSFMEFFKFSGSRKTKQGEVLKWEKQQKAPKVKRFVLSYILIEHNVVGELPKKV